MRNSYPQISFATDQLTKTITCKQNQYSAFLVCISEHLEGSEKVQQLVGVARYKPCFYGNHWPIGREDESVGENMTMNQRLILTFTMKSHRYCNTRTLQAQCASKVGFTEEPLIRFKLDQSGLFGMSHHMYQCILRSCFFKIHIT